MGPFVLIPCSNHFLGISRNLPGFLRVSQVLFLREKIPKTRPKYLGKKTSTKLLQVDLHAKHPLGAPLKIWTSTEINIDDGSNGQTLGTYPQKHIGWWIWINMDKYGWIVLCNLWMIQLDLFWPTLTWLILFKYCSDKKNHRHRTREPMITNDPGRSQLDSRADLSYPLLNLVYLSLVTSSNASLLWLNMAFPPIPSDIRMIRPIISPKFYFIWPFFSWRLCHSLPKKAGVSNGPGGRWRISDVSPPASHCNPWPSSRHCLDLQAAEIRGVFRGKIWGKIYGSSAGYKLHTESYRDIVWYSMISYDIEQQQCS